MYAAHETNVALSLDLQQVAASVVMRYHVPSFLCVLNCTNVRPADSIRHETAMVDCQQSQRIAPGALLSKDMCRYRYSATAMLLSTSYLSRCMLAVARKLAG